ncbi:hypothetical protein PENTCL1PPCAC_2260 [Pristionchus entomophagus]|uniref:C2H2-type domain-containing protein n=1 Tax=Pristionchus entomophagus TaxID=358040 RepID=A0AAV5SIV1_9BILA|nr:hypothetical protein PENTCL1PPCAC_2260 [Pristionchus entomophagus]
MVVVHQRPMTLAMTGPSARVITITREPIGPRSTPGPGRTRWQCSICGKLLSSKRSYDEHLNIHNQARPFTCDHCDYAAASQMTLRRHILRNHTSRDDWHYKCPYCGETYMEPASYQQHVSSRHFGRSATFGCPFTVCTFQTKCSKHFREHLVKHHSCSSISRRNEEEAANSSSRVLPTNPLTLTHESLQNYLVDDDLGVGFGRRLASITRPVVRSNGEIESVLNSAAERVERAANVGNESEEVGSNIVPLHHIPSSSFIASNLPFVPPQRRMVLVRKTERNLDESQSLPSTSSQSSQWSPRVALPQNDLHSLPIIEDDFMKSPLCLRRPTPVSPLLSRIIPRRVQLAPPVHRPSPPSPSSSRGGEGGGGRSRAMSRPPVSPVTLGGSRHAPPMISADAAWTIALEEEVHVINTHVYADGFVDIECD